jgi:hypothetical protein
MDTSRRNCWLVGLRKLDKSLPYDALKKRIHDEHDEVGCGEVREPVLIVVFYGVLSACRLHSGGGVPESCGLMDLRKSGLGGAGYGGRHKQSFPYLQYA